MLPFGLLTRSYTLSTPHDGPSITELTQTRRGLEPPAITWKYDGNRISRRQY